MDFTNKAVAYHFFKTTVYWRARYIHDNKVERFQQFSQPSVLLYVSWV